MRFVIITIATLIACSNSSPPASRSRLLVPKPAPVSAAAAAVVVDPDVEVLNLGFEKLDGDRPAGWGVGVSGKPGNPTPGYETTLDHIAHGGTTSLRFRANGTGGDFVAYSRATDATRFRGKRVRLHGWVKTDSIAAPGYAGVWLRVDGSSEQAFDNMAGRGLRGASTWREAIAQVDVPADAQTLVFGPLLVGAGTAWFDDLRLEITDVTPSKPISVAGIVVDPTGHPAAGATVTMMDATGTITRFTTTDTTGRFHFDAKTGTWAVSANHTSGTGVFLEPREFAADTDDIRLALTDGGVRVHGRLVTKDALPSDVRVEISRYSNVSGDSFVVPVRTDGTFDVRLVQGDKFVGVVRGSATGTLTAMRTDDAVELDIPVTVLGPPPADVNKWVAASTIPLISAEAGHGFTDMKPIDAIIGNAHVVGLGEATHGTREFFQLKHRFLEYLVSQRGFTLFAIEANLPECRAINDYVLNGRGDPKVALNGIYFWTWNTEEVLAMIEWMRTWNANAKHTQKVQFVGFDMQTTTVAYANVVAFLKQVAPTDVDALTAPFAALAKKSSEEDFTAGSKADQAAARQALTALQGRFSSSRASWSKQAGATAVLDAEEDVRVLDQAVAMYLSSDSFAARDKAMAANVDAALARSPKGTRMVLWAHNGHVGNKFDAMDNMGHWLRERHGKDYVIFGFMFGDGSFQAKDWTKGHGEAVTEHTLGAPPAWDASGPFHATGKSIVVIDVRKAPRGPVSDWFAAPHPMRETGAVFTNEQNMSQLQQLSSRFDAIIYVDHTTRARPNPGGVRPAKQD